MMIKFFLNGYCYRIHNKLTLQEILTYFNYQNKIFVIEYNKIVTKKRYQTIKNNDIIEIISIVGGG